MAKRKRLIQIVEPPHGQNVGLGSIIRLQNLVPIQGDPDMIVRIRDRDNQCVWQSRQPFSDTFDVDGFVSECSPGTYSVQVVVPTADVTSQRQVLEFTPKVVTPDASPTGKRFYCPDPWFRMNLTGTRANPCCRLAKRVRNPYHLDAEGYDPWNSRFMVAIREALVRGEGRFCHERCPQLRSEDCAEAEDVFVTDTGTDQANANARRAWENYQAGETRLDSGPLRLALKLGTGCNNYCRFCKIHETRSPFHINENMLNLFRQYAPGLRCLKLTGGEPLVYANDIHRLVDDGIFHENLRVSFMTNGILLEDSAEWLAAMPKLTLSVALNTASEETYRYLHRTDNFKKVIDGIRRVQSLRGERRAYVTLKMLVMRSTRNEIVPFAELARDLDVDQVHYRDLRWNEGMDIDREERIIRESVEYNDAQLQLKEAELLLRDGRSEFSFLGWETRRDDVYDGRDDDMDDFDDMDDAS